MINNYCLSGGFIGAKEHKENPLGKDQQTFVEIVDVVEEARKGLLELA